MKNFITKDDHFGIRKALKKIYKKTYKSGYSPASLGFSLFNDDERVNIWMNQFLPPAYYETLGTIERHVDQIKTIHYRPDWVWIKRGNQYSCANITQQLKGFIDHNEIELPIYQEIEKEKQRWQANSNYNKEEGFSQPLEEEMVQLIIHKGKEVENV